MTVFGIDPAADSFVVGTYPATTTRTFEDSTDGIAAFIGSLPQETPQETLVAVENTGVYGEALCYVLHCAGVPLVLLDSHAVHRAFPGTAKTDALDSHKIAEYAARFRDRLARWQPHADVVEQVRVLLSTREQLVGQRTAALNARHALRRKVVQTPGANAALEAVAGHLKAHTTALEDEIRQLVGAHPTLAQGVSLLVGVPGVGLLLGAQMLVLTQGFTDVPHYRPLAQRLGIAPNAHESGTSVRRPARSRGHGPSAVRKLLHLAARSVRTYDARSRRYFESKVASGKATALVLNNMADRLLRVMCGVLREGQPYRTEHVSLSPLLLTSHRQSG